VKISCPTCAAKYSVADEKIQSRLAKIRCRKCSSTIVIDGMTTPASVYIGDPGAPGASASQDPGATEGVAARTGGAGLSNPAPVPSDPVGPAADEYAVDIADNDQRNMTIHQIVGAYNEGLISADTYIWKEGMPDWQTLAEVKAVADALHAAAARPAPAAAVRRNDHGAAPDLFGRIATAGSEDDITTSAPQPSFSAGTGARNESSVLFSLSALTGGGEATAAPSGGGKRARSPADDSGLIDLTALTASEGSSSGGFGAAGGGFGASPLISAPLGGVSGPAIGAGFMPNYGTQRSGGRTLIIAASLLAVAIIGGTALFVVNRGGSEPEPTSSLEPGPAAAAPAATSPAAKAPSAEAEAEPIAQKPDPTEKETETASVKDSVSADELPAAPEPVKAPVVRAPAAPKPRPAPAPVRAKPAPPPEPAPVAAAPKPAPVERAEPAAEPPPKKKPASRCECAPADLMCAMRCSAKK
jgi:predicted Zn finger-like uncharacterized protein